jgi:hyperosmotically inducible periplasmic protein
MKKLTSVLFAMLIFTAGCGAATARPNAGPAIDDATITTRVKTVLINSPIDNVARIDVETHQGVVTLSGRVISKDEEAKAIALARTVKGVTDVKSALQIQ